MGTVLATKKKNNLTFRVPRNLPEYPLKISTLETTMTRTDFSVWFLKTTNLKIYYKSIFRKTVWEVSVLAKKKKTNDNTEWFTLVD